MPALRASHLSVAVPVEYAAEDGQRVDVSSIRLTVAEMLYVHAREDRELRFRRPGLEELRVQFDRKIADLITREERFLHILLRLLGGVGRMLPDKVTAARVQL